MDTTQKIVGLTLTKTISVSPDGDAKKAGESKQVVLKVKYDGLTLMDLAMKALDKDVVSWQNGSGGRKNYDNLIDKGTVEVDAKSPGKAPQIDPKEAMIARLAAMTPEEMKAELDSMMAKAKATK